MPFSRMATIFIQFFAKNDDDDDGVGGASWELLGAPRSSEEAPHAQLPGAHGKTRNFLRQRVKVEGAKPSD